MKRVLVVSDNALLAREFMSVVEGQDLRSMASFEYCYSAMNRAPKAMVDLGFLPIDMRKVPWAAGAGPDIIFSIHCKQIFPVEIVSNALCVNLHPGFNPHNKGWYPQVFSIVRKSPIGATLHVMTPDVDGGPVIEQELVDVKSWDTSLEVYSRVQLLEIRILRYWVKRVIAGEFDTRKLSEGGGFNSLSDFKQMCELNLNKYGTLGEHIDLLRALSHGDFENAYFVDQDGQKVYVTIRLQRADAEKDGGF